MIKNILCQIKTIQNDTKSQHILNIPLSIDCLKSDTDILPGTDAKVTKKVYRLSVTKWHTL